MERVSRCLVALLLLLVLHLVKGDYNVSVRISHYSNRDHRLYNGRCCDPPISFFWGCLGDCDNYFVVCVGEGSEGVCRHTGEVGRSDSISFYSHVGDLTNPISFNINDTWTGDLVVTVYVIDRDDDFLIFENPDDLIDIFRLTSPTNNRLVRLSGRHASITLSVSVSCSDSYYGSDCTVWCQPSHRWMCDSEGGVVCVEGWTGRECEVCQPSPHCSETGGYCEEPGECHCREGFTGPYCDTPIPSPPPPPPPTSDGSPPSTVTVVTQPSTTIGPSPTPVRILPTDTTEAPLPTTDTTTLPKETNVLPTDPDVTFETQPVVRNKGDNLGGVVGGVVSGLAVLIVLLVLLILGVWLCFYRQRKRRKNRADDVHPLVEPLIGENPMYMVHAMGTHTQQENGREYHQFTNPLYSINQPQSSQAAPSSHHYSYPDRRSHLLASVYLPGDDSPLNGSISSQLQMAGSSPLHQGHTSHNSQGHPSPSTQEHPLPSTQEHPSPSTTQQPTVPSTNAHVEGVYEVITHIPHLDERSPSPSGEERHRMMSISNQHFQLSPGNHH